MTSKARNSTQKSTHANVQNVELILEKFFEYHISYQWDKAKEYIERERDQFRSKNSHLILTSMLHCLAQVIVADRNYLTLQFSSSKVFQRKDLLKSTYENLKTEFRRLEEQSNQLFLKYNFHSLPFQCSPHHNSNHQAPVTSSSSSNDELNDEHNICMESEPAKDALDCVDLEVVPNTTIAIDNKISHSNNNPQESTNPQSLLLSLPQDITNVSTSINLTKNSFFSKLFRRFSSNPNANLTSQLDSSYQAKVQDIASLNMMESLSTDEQQKIYESSSTINLDSLDQFAGHLCGQLLNYCKVRIEMIDFYERLTNIRHQVTIGKFCIIDDYLQTLTNIYSRADDNFHHPVLTRLKMMFMFECDVMLTLLKSHKFIQEWKYLESLFSLQDAHNKINRLANIKEFFLNNNMLFASTIVVNGTQSNNANLLTITKPNSPLFSRQNSSKLFGNRGGVIDTQVPSSSLFSSSCSNLNVPNNNTQKDSYSSVSPNLNHLTSPTNFLITASDSGLSTTNSAIFSTSAKHFLFPRVQTTSSSSSLSMMTLMDSKSIPLLIQWFNRYKLFLLSKYSFYFHSVLLVHLTPVQSSSTTVQSTNSSNSSSLSLVSQNANSMNNTLNYAHTENFMRNLFGKHNLLYDFHSKIVQFIRKIGGTDSPTYITLIWNANGKVDVSLSGYKSPFIQKDIPQGRNSLPIIYTYPSEINMNRHSSLIMIMETHVKELNNSDSVVVEHDKPATTISDSHTNSTNMSNLVTSTNQAAGQPSSGVTSTTTTTIPNATYFLVRPDSDFTLALICESKRLMERDTNNIVAFMQEICFSLKDTKILHSLRTGNFK